LYSIECFVILVYKHACSWHNISIKYVLLRVDEEDYIVEEVVPSIENTHVGNNFYFDICGEEAATPATQGKPRCIYLFFEF
jgi:hypothetical protein